MTELNSLKDALQAVADKQAKALAEIKGAISALNVKISDLQLALGAQEIDAETQSALDAVISGAQELDDLVPDAPIEPPADAEPVEPAAA